MQFKKQREWNCLTLYVFNENLLKRISAYSAFDAVPWYECVPRAKGISKKPFDVLRFHATHNTTVHLLHIYFLGFSVEMSMKKKMKTRGFCIYLRFNVVGFSVFSCCIILFHLILFLLACIAFFAPHILKVKTLF